MLARSALPQGAAVPLVTCESLSALRLGGRAGLADGEGEGFGALFSLLLANPDNAHHFYDRLDAAKGPGFGSNFSLVCPYPMIAHFNELQWAASFGVDKSLMRVWTGQEDADHLIATFEAALDGLENIDSP